jgi:hypothetical protein
MRADGKLDTASLIALFSIFLGWFFIDTLAVTLGSLQHGVRFLDVPAVIADPSRMFLGIDRSWRTYAFGGLCVLCLLSPFAALVGRGRWIRVAHWAPLVLMLICAALLYWKTSQELLTPSGDAASVSSKVVRFANGLVHRGSGVVARHVTVGVGGYLAFLGSIVLALSGLRGSRRPTLNAP